MGLQKVISHYYFTGLFIISGGAELAAIENPMYSGISGYFGRKGVNLISAQNAHLLKQSAFYYLELGHLWSKRGHSGDPILEILQDPSFWRSPILEIPVYP